MRELLPGRHLLSRAARLGRGEDGQIDRLLEEHPGVPGGPRPGPGRYSARGRDQEVGTVRVRCVGGGARGLIATVPFRQQRRAWSIPGMRRGSCARASACCARRLDLVIRPAQDMADASPHDVRVIVADEDVGPRRPRRRGPGSSREAARTALRMFARATCPPCRLRLEQRACRRAARRWPWRCRPDRARLGAAIGGVAWENFLKIPVAAFRGMPGVIADGDPEGAALPSGRDRDHSPLVENVARL